MRNKLPTSSKQKGFTLIELLIVVTILTVLGVTVFVALNPAKRIRDANNARRTADVNTILSAIHSSIVDNNGTEPTGLPTTETGIGTDPTTCNGTTPACGSATACWNAASNLTAYLKSNPIDPEGSPFNSTRTGYSVIKDSNGIVTVKACNAQGGVTIQASQ